MSMTTLSLMEQACKDSDDWFEEREAARKKERSLKPEGATLEQQGEKLYKEIVAKIKEGYGTAEVFCDVHPHCVVEWVINKLKEKGFKATHAFNDGFNDYDIIRVKPDLDERLKEL